MSHRLIDDIGDLEQQLATVDANLAAAKRAEVVDFATIRAMRQRRQELESWIKKANEAIAR